MTREPFIAKAKEYITTYMRDFNVKHEIDVMQPIIETLALDFGVSRQAEKIRLVELGFESAIEIYQTYTISAQNAAVQRFVNQELREETKNGDYIFEENHNGYENAPQERQVAMRKKQIEVLGCKLKPTVMEHQCLNEALHVKYPESLHNVIEYPQPYGIDLGVEI